MSKSNPISFNLNNEEAARLYRVAASIYFREDPTRYDSPKDHSTKIMFEFCRLILSAPYYATTKQLMDLTGLSRTVTSNVIKRHKDLTKQEYAKCRNWQFQTRRK